MAKEIEIKILTTDEQHQLLQSWLDANAEFTGEKTQVEYYLDNPTQSFKFQHRLGYVDASKYLRVRMTPTGDSVCIKVFEIDPETSASKNLAEHESPVQDGETVRQLFAASGFTDQTRVAKVRKSYQAHNFEIEIDDVEDLGVFVEVEVKDHADDTDAGMQAILQLLRDIGFTEINEQARGYVSMLWNPGYDFGRRVEL